MKTAVLALGCSAPVEAPSVADSGTTIVEETAPQEAAAPRVTCAEPPKSMCKTPNEGSVIRGVARFDPSIVPEGKTANLAI